jgi:hypothetical protein
MSPVTAPFFSLPVLSGSSVISPRSLKREIFHRYLTCINLPDQFIDHRSYALSLRAYEICVQLQAIKLRNGVRRMVKDGGRLVRGSRSLQ